MGRLHHAYLFTGTRGVGKTTIARIFAKSLNCEQGITANPCGQCDICTTIEAGQFIDLIEIDAASRTKVEDTREILDNVQYAPTRGRFKVYLIDEVHMLSRHSFNALLKTLEEPPSHVKFLLATTDPQKLPITILSRCLQFNLTALSRPEIVEHLRYILGEENLSFDDESLKLIAKSADGSLRDALSLTDQAIAQSNGALNISQVQQMLGTIDKQWSLKLLAHIANQDAELALKTVDEIALFMPDYRHLLDQLLSIFHLAAMVQLVPGVARIEENQQAFISRLAQKLSAQDVQLYYQILLNGKKDIELAPDARMGFEMVLLRLLAFQPLAKVVRPINHQLDENDDLLPVAQPMAAIAPQTSSDAKKNSEISPAVKSDPQSERQLEMATLNAQQNSLLFAAQEQGFKPVVAEPVTQVLAAIEPVADKPIQISAEKQPIESTPLFGEVVQSKCQTVENAIEPATSIEPAVVIEPVVAIKQQVAIEPQVMAQEPPMLDISFKDDEEEHSHYDDMMQDQGVYQEQVTQTAMPTLKPIQAKADGKAEHYEDPVAAILANRNLPIKNLFGSGADETIAAEQEKTVKPYKPPIRNVQSESQPEPQVRAAEAVVENNGTNNDLFKPRVAKGVKSVEPLFKARLPLFDESKNQKTPPVERKPAVEAAIEPECKLELKPAVEVQNVLQSKPQVAIDIGQEEPHLQPPNKKVATVAEQQSISHQTAETSRPRWAAEVDEWAALIEQMGLGGLVRIIAVQSVWHKADKIVTLTVASDQQHLDSTGLREQLTKALIRVLNEIIELDIKFSDQVHQCPLNIQRKIDADRLVYAKDSIYQDSLILALQETFSAQVDDSTIAAVG
jgi:DNA polymerase-3 subunit gamma/tau